MISREELTLRLNRLSTRLRTAFTVGCAERVLCLYDLDCQPNDPRIKTAVDLAWRYAGGEEPELDELDAAEDGLREAIPNPNDVSGQTPAYLACLALGFALDAIDDPTAESAVNAAFEALDAVDVFEDYFEPESLTWSLIEHDWQRRALAVCESVNTDAVGRNVFAPLGPPLPVWFRSRDTDAG